MVAEAQYYIIKLNHTEGEQSLRENIHKIH